ncbi:MAG: transglycosylase domain-containing protein [Bacilli bacterium]|nr:transglycosylase domain-containing protein [Bacilli bacterium]
MSALKTEIKKIVNYFSKKPIRLSVPLFSLIIFIVLAIVFNFVIGLILAILINLIWIIPYVKSRKATKVRENIEGRDEMPTKKDKKVKKEKTNKKKKVKIILLIILSIFIFLILLAIAFFMFIAITAPKFDPNNLYTKEASVLYDSNGKELAKLGSEMRQKVKYDEVSETLINAIVATEDSRFFEHNGFDLPRFIKASFGQVLGHSSGGASTLTMQVSKNQFTSTTSSGFAGIKRKFTDIYLSIFQIEKKYSKEEIIEFYVNSYYLGSGSYGVEQASKTYFNKSAKDLNVSEAAMIAGMFQSPVSFDPNLNPDRTEKRRLLVLSLMKRHGYISDEEYKIAKEMTVDKIVIKGHSANKDYSAYQGFIDTVAVDVKDSTGYDPYSYSMKIYTTMDREKQDEINKIMNGETFTWENDKVDAGIAVIDTKTGNIIAVGAGRNHQDAKSFNNATMMKKQIGSTAKPLFDYGPAIEYLDWNTYHPIIDAKYSYSNGTEINNWDGGYKGIITIRQALVDSRNIPALKTFQSVKNSDVKDFVTKLGLSPEIDTTGHLHEAHAIGGYNGESPLSVAAAYAAFGNEGTYNKPHSFTKVVFEENNKTFTPDNDSEKVMGKDTAYMVTDMLVDTGKSALGNYSNVNGATFAAKTGTTNFDKETMRLRGLPSNAVNDLWVAGYNADYAIAVWYGYDTIKDGHNRFGSSQNSRLFQAVAKNFFKSSTQFNKPDNVVEVTVEKNCATPLLPSSNTPDSEKTTELFKQDAKPTEVSNRFNSLGNVSDVKGSVTGRKATITWKPIGTPDGLNSEYWRPFVNKAFAISSDQTTYLYHIMDYNNSVLGKVIYNVYKKDTNELVASVDGNSATFTVSGSNPSYIIKTAYSNFGGGQSSGVEVKIDYKGTSSDDINVSLEGKSDITVTASEGYTDLSKPLKATLAGEDVTNEVKVTTTYTKDGGSSTAYNHTRLTEPGVYVFTYKVTYEGETVDTIDNARTVTIE